MAANSNGSQANDKRSTSKTSSVTAAQGLEILQEALLRCQHAGLDVRIGAGTNGNLVVMLGGVEVRAGNIVLANAGNLSDEAARE
jgi:hypothetical protein